MKEKANQFVMIARLKKGLLSAGWTSLAKAAAVAAIAFAFAWGGTPGASADTLFQSNFEGSTVQSPTTLANLNLGTPVGTWSGFDDSRPLDAAPSTGIWQNTAGTLHALLMDRDLTTSPTGFILNANMTQPANLADGVTVTFKAAPRRTGDATPLKNAVYTGLDSAGNISFQVRLYVSGAPREPATTQVFQYTTDGTLSAPKPRSRMARRTSPTVEARSTSAAPRSEPPR
ncbi:MAG: hypothetical protein NTW86_05195 [Candidatus Sumerlaeota bacterium]|nr:hypothetical protein [Candidatus Sumerlaeota bacterium]